MTPTMSRAMLILVVAVGSREYQRKRWWLNLNTIRACERRGLIEYVRGPLPPQLVLTDKGRAVAEVAEQLFAVEGLAIRACEARLRTRLCSVCSEVSP